MRFVATNKTVREDPRLLNAVNNNSINNDTTNENEDKNTSKTICLSMINIDLLSFVNILPQLTKAALFMDIITTMMKITIYYKL